MKRVYQLRRPTKHYDEKVRPLDQQLSELIAKRKSVSNDNPGFPPIEQIQLWARQFDLYENHLHSVFHCLYNEDLYRPQVEPVGFLGIKPVMKLVEKDSRVYLITHMRQYENASVLYFQIDSKSEHREDLHHPRPIEWELSLGPEYECYFTGGGGSGEQRTYQFVVSPRLSDDVKDISFTFRCKYMYSDENIEDISGEIILK